MRVSLPSRRESIWSPSADGERRQGCAQHCEHAGTKEPLAVSFISSWEQGKVKVGVLSASHPLLPSEDPSQIPKIPILTAEMQTIHRKHERSPSCYPRLKLQELKIAPTHTHKKKSSFPAAVHPLFINYLWSILCFLNSDHTNEEIH